MTDWTQKILNQYANKQAAGGNKLNLSNFGSVAAPTDYDLKANNYQGMITQGIGGLVDFAQAGERRREEARKEAIGAEEVNYQREQDAANMALKLKQDGREGQRLDLDLDVLKRAKQKDASKAKAAGYLQQANEINKGVFSARSGLHDLVNQHQGLGIFRGTEDGKNIIGDFSDIDKSFAAYQETNKKNPNALSKEDFTKVVGTVKNQYDTLQGSILGGEKGIQGLRQQYKEARLAGSTTADLADDIGNLSDADWAGASSHEATASEKAITAENTAQIDKRVQELQKNYEKGSNQDIFRTNLQNLSKYGGKVSTKLDGYLSNLGEDEQEHSGEIRNQATEIYNTFKANPTMAENFSDDELLVAAIQGTMRAKGNTDWWLRGVIGEDDASRYATAELTNIGSLKSEDKALQAAINKELRNKSLVQGKANILNYGSVINK